MALTLHAFWFRQRLWLWSETVRALPNGGAAADEAAVAELRAALGEVSPDGLLAEAAAADVARLWLPCDERGVPIACGVAAGRPVESEQQSVATLVVGALLPVS